MASTSTMRCAVVALALVAASYGPIAAVAADLRDIYNSGEFNVTERVGTKPGSWFCMVTHNPPNGVPEWDIYAFAFTGRGIFILTFARPLASEGPATVQVADQRVVGTGHNSPHGGAIEIDVQQAGYPRFVATLNQASRLFVSGQGFSWSLPLPGNTDLWGAMKDCMMDAQLRTLMMMK
jgi:hypothetical protein